MTEPFEVRRAGTLTPFEVQVRRVETHAAFLLRQLQRLEDLVYAGERMTADQLQNVDEALDDVRGVGLRILALHGSPR
jgi:hypothetical protein